MQKRDGILIKIFQALARSLDDDNVVWRMMSAFFDDGKLWNSSRFFYRIL